MRAQYRAGTRALPAVAGRRPLTAVLVALTAAAVAGLLAAEGRSLRWGVWLAKPLASAGFLAVAVSAGALDNVYGRWVLAALLLCFAGDVLLIPRGARGAFSAGLASFLLGHLVFARAFAVLGPDTRVLAAAALAAGVPAVLALRWLRPHLPAALRAAVIAYVVAISVMVVVAVATLPAGADLRIPAGAVLFYLSDLLVARERFVTRGFVNKALGLPLYYGGQLLLAASA